MGVLLLYKRFKKCRDRGQGLVEYGLILALVAIAAVVALGTLGPQVSQFFKKPANILAIDFDAAYTPHQLFEVPSPVVFTGNKGAPHSLYEYQGKPVAVMLWSSTDSNRDAILGSLQNYQNVATANNVELLFLDTSNESWQTTAMLLSSYGITTQTFLTDNGKLQGLLTGDPLPAYLFINAGGLLTGYSAGLMSEAIFEAHILNTANGLGTETANFVVENMMDTNGGIHSQYGATRAITEGAAVFSESQGVFLEYALSRGDRRLFDQTFNYINTEMKTAGLTSWVVYSPGNASQTNALIDDFRIYQALTQANDMWHGYDSEIAGYQAKLLNYGLTGDHYIDCYDAAGGIRGTRLTLCFIDPLAMSSLSKSDSRFSVPETNALTVLTGGRISDEFPVYYSYYDYNTANYIPSELNMAEAMVTLLHMAEIDKLDPVTINWLKNQMNAGGIKARYDVAGNVIPGYDFESTAIYAILACVADEIGDTELRGQALRKMSNMRIIDASVPHNGAFGMPDGSGIYSFDQLMPVLAYERLN